MGAQKREESVDTQYSEAYKTETRDGVYKKWFGRQAPAAVIANPSLQLPCSFLGAWRGFDAIFIAKLDSGKLIATPLQTTLYARASALLRTPVRPLEPTEGPFVEDPWSCLKWKETSRPLHVRSLTYDEHQVDALLSASTSSADFQMIRSLSDM